MTKVDQYKCDYCGEVFNDYDKCLAHEYEHQNDDVSRAKYLIRYNLRKDLCDYCEHSYFVYGCEIDCQFKKNCNYKNNYELFAPVKPFHDKSIQGY